MLVVCCSQSHPLLPQSYRPEDSRHFDVTKSSSFKAKPEQTQDMHYADGTHLRSFTGVDQVRCSSGRGRRASCLVVLVRH